MGAATVEIDEVLPRVHLFEGKTVTAAPLVGGLSHQIWRVDADGRSYVLRVLDESLASVGLGIPAPKEVANTMAAADSGAGARVLEVLTAPAAVVLEYLPGVTLDNAAVLAAIGPVAAACRQLHAGPRFGNDFDIVTKRAELLDVCRRNGLRLPDGYLDRSPVVDRIARVLAENPVPTVPCHNDLLAANFVESAGRIRIVDYQLSGNNDPSFELGDIAAEADFDPDQTDRLSAAYFAAECTEAWRARVRLQVALSNTTWTLWFAVHHGLLSNAAADFDYPAEAADKWTQACRDLDGPGLGPLLQAAHHRT